MHILTITPDHDLWLACFAHLERVEMLVWLIDERGLLREGLHILGAVEDGQVVGHLALKRQPIVVPATAGSGGVETPVVGPDGAPLEELFVYTFAVDQGCRRRGIGRALQIAGLELARDLGCYQVRSWSSLDKPANYALKIGLGFAIHPAVYTTGDGLAISGVYFVKTVAEYPLPAKGGR